MQNTQFLKNLGRDLAACRIYAGMSQKSAAEEIGITSRFLSTIENGRRAPSSTTLQKLVALYDAQVLVRRNEGNHA